MTKLYAISQQNRSYLLKGTLEKLNLLGKISWSTLLKVEKDMHLLDTSRKHFFFLLFFLCCGNHHKGGKKTLIKLTSGD